HVVLVPERAQFGVEQAVPSADKVDAVMRNARLYVTEFAGRRAVRAVGHNLRVAVSEDELPRDFVLDELLPGRQLGDLLGVEPLRDGEADFNFRHGNSTRNRLKLIVPPGDEAVRLDLNYHFQ